MRRLPHHDEDVAGGAHPQAADGSLVPGLVRGGEVVGLVFDQQDAPIRQLGAEVRVEPPLGARQSEIGPVAGKYRVMSRITWIGLL